MVDRALLARGLKMRFATLVGEKIQAPEVKSLADSEDGDATGDCLERRRL